MEESWLEDDRSQVFMNASMLALRDGQLSNGEKRILVKLAHALRLQEDEPKRIYDAILSGETDRTSGDKLGHSEKILVYGQVLEAMLIHTDRSEEVIAQIAYLRKMFAIEEALLDSGCGEILQLAAVDYPWVTEELFISLQEGLDDDNALIMPHDGEVSHPLLALIRSEDVLGILHSDRRSLRAQFAEVKHSILIEEPEILRNVNSPEDLK